MEKEKIFSLLKKSGWMDIAAFAAGIAYTAAIAVFYCLDYAPEPIDDFATAVGVGFILALGIFAAAAVLAVFNVLGFIVFLSGLRSFRLAKAAQEDTSAACRIRSMTVCPIIYLILFFCLGFVILPAASSVRGVAAALSAAVLLAAFLIASVILKSVAVSRMLKRIAAMRTQSPFPLAPPR